MSKIVGLRVDEPRVGAPEFVKARVGINVAQFGQWLVQNVDDRGWVNLDLLLSKAGDLYLKHNEFKRKVAGMPPPGELYADPPPPEEDDMKGDKIPF